MSDGLPPPPSAAQPIADVLARLLAALDALGALGEEVADEWQYVQDLVRVHGMDLRAAAAADPRPVDRLSVRAIDLLIDEAGRITDPHRAIDWLSTLPQAVRLALSLRVEAA